MGTGVVVAIDHRRFILTAARHVPRDPETTLLVGEKPGRSNRPQGSVIAHDKQLAPFDVAFLEVSQAFVSSRNLVPIGLERMEPYLASPRNDLVLVIGHPACLARPRPRAATIHGTLTAYMVHTLEPSEWPSVHLEHPLDPAVDIFMPYARDDIDAETDDGVAASVPGPHGFSGAGIWRMNVATRGLWTPERATPIGIQKTWVGKKHARGTQIQHCLDLIARTYSDLAPTIRSYLTTPRSARRGVSDDVCE